MLFYLLSRLKDRSPATQAGLYSASFYPHFKKISINVQKGFIPFAKNKDIFQPRESRRHIEDRKRLCIHLILALAFVTFGCTGHEKSGQDRLREQNARGEYVYRNHDEKQYPPTAPTPRERAPYPWEVENKPQ